MTSGQICIMVAIVIYLASVIAVGVIYSKKTNNVGDFYLGGRKLGPLVTAMSAEASDMSSYLLMGLPGLALASGLAEVSWTVIGLAIGTYLNWLIVAKRLRKYTAHIGAITIPDYFSRRYNDQKNVLMGIAAIMIIIFFVPYTASGFAACGKLFATLFGMNYHTAMIISAVVIVGYTTLGGFNAASITDFIQAIVMSVALIIVLIFGIVKTGGIEAVTENAQNLAGYLNMFQGHDAVTGKAGSFGAIPVISTLAWGLGYFGMPHILLRFMAIENPNKIKTSRRVATVWVVISMAVAVFIGVVGLALVKENVLPAFKDSETVIVQIANYMSTHGVALAFTAGIILAGILASTMSTADSQLLAASSAASENVIGGLFKANISEKNKMLVARLTLVIISIIGVFIAWNQNSSVFGIVSFAWAGFGATFGPVVLLSLFWRRSNKNGAIWGMVAAGIMVFLWKYGIAKLSPILNIYELLPAFLTGLAVNVIVSLATKAPDDEVTKAFDEVKNMK